MAERAYRGGNGKTPGLGRERIYLEAFIRVGEHLAQNATDEGDSSRAGRSASRRSRLITPFVRKARATDPPPTTPRRLPWR